MDTRDIMPDPCDNRIIRCNNCIQYFSCNMRMLASAIPSLADCADLLDVAAECNFYSTAACMTAQIEHELKQLGNTRALNWQAAQQAQQIKLQEVYAKRGGGQQAPQVAPYQSPAAPQAQVVEGRVQQVQLAAGTG